MSTENIENSLLLWGKDRVMSMRLGQDDLEQVGKHLRKIQTLAEAARLLEKKQRNTADQMDTFINSLSDERRHQLQIQLDEYICVNHMIH